MRRSWPSGASGDICDVRFLNLLGVYLDEHYDIWGKKWTRTLLGPILTVTPCLSVSTNLCVSCLGDPESLWGDRVSLRWRRDRK